MPSTARRYALTGDSSFHQEEIDFLAGRELAVIDSGHLSDEEIVELAARTQARRLVCSHLYRELDAAALNARAAEAGYTGELIVGEDGMVSRDLACFQHQRAASPDGPGPRARVIW